MFEIFSTAKDQQELETRIVEAYDTTKALIEKQKARVERTKSMEGYESYEYLSDDK